MNDLTKKERDSFRQYAEDNMTEGDGTQCQWADYTVRLVDQCERQAAVVEAAVKKAGTCDSNHPCCQAILALAKLEKS